MTDASVASTGSKSSVKRQREMRNRLQKQQAAVAGVAAASIGSMSTISTKMLVTGGTKAMTGAAAVAETRESQSTTGSMSTLSTKPPLLSTRREKIVQMVRSKSRSLTGPRPPFYPGAAKSPKVKNMVRQKQQQQQEQQRQRRMSGAQQQLQQQQQHSGITSMASMESTRCKRNKLLDIAILRRQQSINSTGSMKSLSRSSSQSNHRTRTVFHVRLSMGYLTGLRLDKIPKNSSGGRGSKSGKNGQNNNHLVLGFVELAQSGKFMALSQPLLPNVGDSSGSGSSSRNKATTTRVVWASPKVQGDSSSRGGGSVSTASKSRRRLHFAIPLERETSGADEERDAGNDHDTADDDDVDSIGSHASFVPEVVHLLVGLKCGDEKIPLGIAKLVVNGRETMEQKMDLLVEPETNLNVNGKPKRRLFGGSWKKANRKNYFANGYHSFKLAANATLRVKADVKTGIAGQRGAEIWGNDDSSYTTNWTYDASSSAVAATADVRDMPDMPDPTSVLGLVESPATNHIANHEIPPPPGMVTLNDDSFRTDRVSLATDINPTSHGVSKRLNQVPVKFVALRSPTSSSLAMSELTVPDPGCDAGWCFSMVCGDDVPTKSSKSRRTRRRITAKSFSFESSKKSDGSGTSSGSESSESSIHVEDLKGTTISINKNMDMMPPRSEMKDDQVETLDVTAKQYKDLKEAQQTLLRYASKVGVPMEDLLERQKMA